MKEQGGTQNVSERKNKKLVAIVTSSIIIAAVGIWSAAILKANSDSSKYRLEFTEISSSKIESLNADIDLNNMEIVEEKIIDKEIAAFICKDNDGYIGVVRKDGQTFYLDQVSMENTPEDLMGIEELEIFGKKAVKLYGILGANYAHALYWLVDERMEDSVIQIDGSTIEADLDNDDRNEIIATMGTIPETRIYMLKEGKIHVSDINKSIGARSVYLINEGSKLFEVYFEPNKPEQFLYQNDCFVKK